MNGNISSWSYLTAPTGIVYRPQMVRLTFGYRKRNQKKIRRLRRQGAKV